MLEKILLTDEEVYDVCKKRSLWGEPVDASYVMATVAEAVEAQVKKMVEAMEGYKICGIITNSLVGYWIPVDIVQALKQELGMWEVNDEML